jgi:acyl carrier protein
MGLEGIEILMEVEEAFDISIEDSEAERSSTPGELIDVVAWWRLQ